MALLQSYKISLNATGSVTRGRNILACASMWASERRRSVAQLALWSSFQHDRTEMIKDDLNPRWVKKFQVDYYFEEKQYLRFEL